MANTIVFKQRCLFRTLGGKLERLVFNFIDVSNLTSKTIFLCNFFECQREFDSYKFTSFLKFQNVIGPNCVRNGRATPRELLPPNNLKTIQENCSSKFQKVSSLSGKTRRRKFAPSFHHRGGKLGRKKAKGGGVRTRPDVVIINDLIHLNKRIERREGEKKVAREKKKENVPIF